jgi:hypothetical protein
MIRAETDTHWLLITHPDHAALAGKFADAWGNQQFAAPDLFEHVRRAVYHHDDGWIKRDAEPGLTPAGIPEAFTRALVGAYSAFEEIDLPSYLKVRGAATAEVAAQDPIAGIIVSMHTVNLLTEQADVSTIKPEHRPAHAEFVAQQRAWQAAETTRHGVDPAALQRGFEFLQACDNFSLIACSGFGEARPLRHRHPDRKGELHELHCSPRESGGYTLSPWPMDQPQLSFELPFRRVAKDACADLTRYRAAFAAAEIELQPIRLTAA